MNGALEVDTFAGVVWATNRSVADAVAELIWWECGAAERDPITVIVLPADREVSLPAQRSRLFRRG